MREHCESSHAPAEGSVPAAEEAERLRSLLDAERLRVVALRNELARHIAHYSGYRFRVIDKVHRRLRRRPLLFAVVCYLFSTTLEALNLARWLALAGLTLIIGLAQRMLARLRHARNVGRALGRGLLELAFRDSTMSWVRRRYGWSGLWAYASLRLREVLQGPAIDELDRWLTRVRPSPRLLRRFARRRWPKQAPRFAVLVRVGSADRASLERTLRSLTRQIYPNWDLIVVTPMDVPIAPHQLSEALAELPGEVRFLSRRSFAEALVEIVETAAGDCFCVMDAGDALEPHALYRFADAALQQPAELIYSDMLLVDENGEAVTINARPAFSHDYLLSYDYLSQGCVASRAALRQALAVKPIPVNDYDLRLRIVEHTAMVAHLPEVLYHRPCAAIGGLDAEAAIRAVSSHLRRIGAEATVAPTDDPSCRDIRFAGQASDKVAIIIPTKNQAALVRQCLDSLERTVPPALADIYVVDHASDDADTKAYLGGLKGRRRVIHYAAPFNFSAINNHAVAELGGRYSHYLFLNNDTEATASGWLEHMLGYADRKDVGVVGALLLYPNRTSQHAGVIVGLHFGADHGCKGLPAYTLDGQRRPGPHGALLASREQSAVTGACLLIRSDVFHELGGFDEAFVVGFGDTDICLRAREKGYKVILDVQAVLLHHESATRGAHPRDPHPEDTKRFRARHLRTILAGDPFYSPLLSRQFAYELNPLVLVARQLSPRISRLSRPVLPSAERSSRVAA